MNPSREMVVFLQNNLKALRALAKWNQQELATKLGVSRQTVINIESGQTSLTTTTFLAIMFLLIREQNKNSLLRDALSGFYKTSLETAESETGKNKKNANVMEEFAMTINYLSDPDLDFLENASNEDLDTLFLYLTKDKDGDARLTGDLENDHQVIRYHPDHHIYWQKIAAEVQYYGGNTIANNMRGHGAFYRKVLIDVCKKLKVNFNETAPISIIEQNLLMKIMTTSLEKMNEEELTDVVNEMHIPVTSFTKQALTAAIQGAIIAGSFSTYTMAVIIANQVARALAGRGLAVAANAALTRTIGIFAGPIGWVLLSLWTIIDVAGPAYRVTIPCVIQIAYLRVKASLHEEESVVEQQG